jgi:hypothetical protein
VSVRRSSAVWLWKHVKLVVEFSVQYSVAESLRFARYAVEKRLSQYDCLLGK